MNECFGSVALTRDAATKLPVHTRPDSRAVKVMAFETARMRTGSETLLSSKLQLNQAMRALSAVVGVAQSATVVIPRIDCRILRW